MRRFSMVLALVAVALGALPPTHQVAAATTVSYRIVGTAAPTTFPQVTMAGVALAESRTEFGVWKAALSQDLGAILGGSFKFTSRARTVNETFAGGTYAGIGAGTCAKSSIAIHGVLAGGGLLDATLTRYGTLKGGSCVVVFSTVVGTLTLVG